MSHPEDTTDMPPETGTDPNIRVVRNEVRAAQAHVEGAMKRGLMLSDLKALAMTVIAILGGGYAVLHTLDNRAQAQVDAGAALVEAKVAAKLATLEGEIGALKQQMNENKSVTTATNDTVNKLAVRMGVVPTVPTPVPPAPAPKDGGP